MRSFIFALIIFALGLPIQAIAAKPPHVYGHAREVTPDQARTRSSRAFMNGRVDTATGPLMGGQALMEIAAMPGSLALGGTAILLVAAPAGF